jgi:hypothetical protein
VAGSLFSEDQDVLIAVETKEPPVMDVESVLVEVKRIAQSLHSAGTFSSAALEAIVRHASDRPVHRSVETGSGASTLLLSHLSENHIVFAVDGGTGSIRSIEASTLLRRGVVTFVEGPTQLTLPRHTFEQSLQLALIDGPHAYPFPDLEYYYLYPHMDTGALLIVDDIHIPTITNLFHFLSADEMFELQDVVDTTAFFRRTEAATFPTTSDGWLTQRYNGRVFESIEPQVVTPDRERVQRHTASYLDQFGPHRDPLRLSNIVVRCDEDLVISGWAVDSGQRRPAAAVDLVLDGISYRTAVRVPRADVARAQGDYGCLASGFNARFPPGVLKPGPHQLDVRILLNGELESSPAVHLQFVGI